MVTWKDGRRREPLPIDERLPELIRLLGDHQVVIVEAETGAGKTTRIPQAYALAHTGDRVTMTQTRRPAVRWNGKRIAAEMGSEPGGTVGWRLFGEQPRVSKDTRVTLVIDRGLANRIRKSGRLPQGLIVVDEAHERSIDTDLLLGLIKEALPQSPGTKVLVTSATIDTTKFSQFFWDAPIVSVSGRCFPVEIPMVVRLDRYEHHSQGAARAANMVLGDFLSGKLTVAGRVVTRGTVIVLLPGKDDITSVMTSLERGIPEGGEGRVQILSYHGESLPEEGDAVQSPPQDGVIRFVCGTEILRTSVTVVNTIGVIDSLQVKRRVTDEKGVSHLAKVVVSRAEADQGKGRAGRTQEGFYIPVSFDSEYERLAPYPVPAIFREPIENVALQVAAINRSARNFAFIEAPAGAKVDVAIKRLQRLGALDAEEKITEVGRFLVQLPIEPKSAKTLMMAETLGVLSEAVVAVACLEQEGVFFRHFRPDTPEIIVSAEVRGALMEKARRYQITEEETETPLLGFKKEGGGWRINLQILDMEYGIEMRTIPDLVRQGWAGDSRSDFVATVRVYRAFKAEERRLKYDPEEGEETPSRKARERALRTWCESNLVNMKRVRMAELVMRQIREELAGTPLRLENPLAEERGFDVSSLTKAIAAGHLDNVARRSDYGFSGALGNFQLAYQSACPQDAGFVVVGGVSKIPGKKGRKLLIADMAAPIDPAWFSEVAPHLVERRRQGDCRYSPGRDTVTETALIYFADLRIGDEQVEVANPEVATRTLAGWLADQMLTG